MGIKECVVKKRPLVMVEWDDISSENSWASEKSEEFPDERCKPLRCVSVGWRMPSDKGVMTIASTRSEHGKCTDRTCIPKSVIRSIRRLE